MQHFSYNIIGPDTQTEKERHICRYMRYVIAAIFIASGMMKGINIDGLSQSVSAYISLLGMTTKYAYTLGGFLCIAEIAIGFSAMHYDIFRKLHWTYTVVMIFFTSITFLNMTSVYGGIESCGCFGELIHLNPAQSFYKNIVILMICMISSLYITFKSGREQIFTSTLFRKILKLIIGATLPIAFSIAFKNTLEETAYTCGYIAICIISLAIVLSSLNINRILFRRLAFFAIISISLTSCDVEMKKALKLAGDNRTEIEKVLEHFKHDPNPLKCEAARFLIGNMLYHTSAYGDAMEKYDSAYLSMSEAPLQLRDSIFAASAEGFDFSSCKTDRDINSLSADYLIQAVEDACAIWEQSSWSNEYDKSLFFDYVLPYRILNEPPSEWHSTVAQEYPYLNSDDVCSKRGVYYEAEEAEMKRSKVTSTESASGGLMSMLTQENSAVTFTLTSPIRARKNIYFRYTSTTGDAEIEVYLNGKSIDKCRLEPTKTMHMFRDSRTGVPVSLDEGENKLTVCLINGRVGLDRIMVSAVESFNPKESTDFSRALFRVKNAATGSYVTFDTLRNSLLNHVKLLPLTEKDSCSMLRFDNRGAGNWSICAFKKDSIDLSLEVQYCSTVEGAPISQYKYLNGNHQKWVLLPAGDGHYKIMGKDSGLFLESSTDNDGTETIIQTQYAGKPSQKWQLEECGPNDISDQLYPFGSAAAQALRVFDMTNQFEWHAFKGAIPPKATSLLKGRSGNCRDEASFTVYLCRYLGIPAAVDFTPHWGNRSQGHSWSVLIKPDGTSMPFYMGCAPGDTVHYYHSYIKPKVFRHRFRLNRTIAKDLKGEKSVPKLFKNAKFIDVTDEYYTTTDVTRTVPKQIEEKVAYICVFDNRNWVPVYYGNISNNKVTFKSMGRNIVYIAATFRNGQIVPFGNPFLVASDGNVYDIEANEQERKPMTIMRKYPFMGRQDHFNGRMSGGKFQVANKSDFSDAITVHTHEGITNGNWYDIPIEETGRYSYARYLGPNGSYCNVNEIEFVAEDGKAIAGKVIGSQGEQGKTADKVFDGDILTGFHGLSPDGHWIGLKFTQPERISRIRYIPRNDGNCIEIANEYELLYWHNNGWESLGKQVATENRLVYSKVPSSGLYVVRNLTKGHEERIFTYTDEQQIWW